MCLFVGILFLVGLPLSVLNGTWSGDPVLAAMLWLMGLAALVLRIRQESAKRR